MCMITKASQVRWYNILSQTIDCLQLGLDKQTFDEDALALRMDIFTTTRAKAREFWISIDYTCVCVWLGADYNYLYSLCESSWNNITSTQHTLTHTSCLLRCSNRVSTFSFSFYFFFLLLVYVPFIILFLAFIPTAIVSSPTSQSFIIQTKLIKTEKSSIFCLSPCQALWAHICAVTSQQALITWI